MAQILVFTGNNADQKDFQNGDPIAVADDNHVWGKREITGPFRVVNLPGPKEDYLYLCDMDNNDRHRKYRINPTDKIIAKGQ